MCKSWYIHPSRDEQQSSNGAIFRKWFANQSQAEELMSSKTKKKGLPSRAADAITCLEYSLSEPSRHAMGSHRKEKPGALPASPSRPPAMWASHLRPASPADLPPPMTNRTKDLLNWVQSTYRITKTIDHQNIIFILSTKKDKTELFPELELRDHKFSSARQRLLSSVSKARGGGGYSRFVPCTADS